MKMAVDIPVASNAEVRINDLRGFALKMGIGRQASKAEQLGRRAGSDAWLRARTKGVLP